MVPIRVRRFHVTDWSSLGDNANDAARKVERVQLEVRVAVGGDHRLALREQVSAEAHALVT